MSSDFIVKYLDVLDNLQIHLFCSQEFISVNQLAFKALKEALCYGIISAITSSGYNLRHILIQSITQLFASILYTLIRMKDHARLRSATSNRHPVSPDRSLCYRESTAINGKQMLENKDLRMLLKVCDRTLIRWRQTKKLKGFKIGSKVYFMAADVNEFVRSEYYLQTQKAQQPIKNLDYERIQKKQ